MKNIICYIILIVSLLTNILYFIYLDEQRKNKDEFYTIFEVNETSYEKGYSEFNEKLNITGNRKSHHLIHIWDTFFVNPAKSIPYFLELDSFLRCKSFKSIDCILISSMRDETISNYFSSKKIKFTNITLMNDMDNFISGVCNQRNLKTKMHGVNLLINEEGDILYYDSKIKFTVEKDSSILKIFNSLK